MRPSARRIAVRPPRRPRRRGGHVPVRAKLIWNSRSSDLSRTVVDVIWANPDDVRALTRPEMTQDRWRSFLTVRVVRKDSPGAGDLPPLLGTYRVADGVLRFEPRFPLEPGLPYRAEFDPARLHEVAQSLSPGQGKGGPRHRRPPG